MQRLKIINFVSGPGSKQFIVETLSGSTSANMVSVSEHTYVAGMISGDMSSDMASVSADGILYDLKHFRRDYSVNHNDIYTNGYDIQYRSPEADITDMAQFGNYAFNLTVPIISGTTYTDRIYAEWEDDRTWVMEPHEIITYVPGSSACIPDLIIDRTVFSLNNVYVYSDVIDGQQMLYVKSLFNNVSANTVYETVESYKLPFNYLLEEPLHNNPHFISSLYGDYDSSLSANIVFGTDESLDIFYCSEGNRDNRVLMNPTPTKNMYNYNFNIEIDRNRQVATGWRNYSAIGNTQNTLWLKYNYIRETSDFSENYDLAERVRGLYKFKPADLHKSNVYSIRIKNSGLNRIADDTLRTNIQNIVAEELLKTVKKLQPAHTQLWKVEWEGGFKP